MADPPDYLVGCSYHTPKWKLWLGHRRGLRLFQPFSIAMVHYNVKKPVDLYSKRSETWLR